MVTVSAIITTYNRSALLVEAIHSVLNQTFPDFEVLVVDDGSTDDTAAVVNQINDQRICYIYQNNAGQAAARNTGIRSARGEYVAFLDDDDYWLPGKLQIQLSAMRDNPGVGMLSSGWININEQAELISESRPWEWSPILDINTWVTACPVITCSILVKTAWLNRIGGFDESITRERLGAEDWDAWLRLSYAGCPMAWEHSLVCAYRIHQGTFSKDAMRQTRGGIKVIEKFFSQKDLPERLLMQKDHAIANLHLRGAARLYAGGMAVEAKDNIAAAIKRDPALLANDGEAILQVLLDWVTAPIVDNYVAYVNAFMNNLPEEMSAFSHSRRKILGSAAKIVFFSSAKSGHHYAALHCLFQMAPYHPKLLYDRGVFSVLLDLLVGKSFAARLKHK
jgi:glycosyltransferase involved in cell wall biosynthesis